MRRQRADGTRAEEEDDALPAAGEMPGVSQRCRDRRRRRPNGVARRAGRCGQLAKRARVCLEHFGHCDEVAASVVVTPAAARSKSALSPGRCDEDGARLAGQRVELGEECGQLLVAQAELRRGRSRGRASRAG